MIYCNELPFGILFPYHYLNIETMYILILERLIWIGKNILQICQILKTMQFTMQNSLYYLELVSIMSPQIASKHIDLTLSYKTDLKHFRMETDKIMGKYKSQKKNR